MGIFDKTQKNIDSLVKALLNIVGMIDGTLNDKTTLTEKEMKLIIKRLVLITEALNRESKRTDLIQDRLKDVLNRVNEMQSNFNSNQSNFNNIKTDLNAILNISNK